MREALRKGTFAPCWMSFIPPPHATKLSSCRSSSCSPWVEDSAYVEGYWIQDRHPPSSSGGHSLHEYCMKCLMTISALLNSVT